MIKIEKLFKANSIVKNFNGNKNVKIQWYYADEQWAEANYNNIIKGYDDMSPEDKKKAEEVINEYFTLDEVQFISTYIKGKFNNINVVEISLPMDVKYCDQEDNAVKMYEPLTFLAYGYNTICLDKQEDYDLPFKVWGYICSNINTFEK